MKTVMNTLLAPVLLLTGLMAATPALSEQLDFDRTFVVAPGGRLTVQADGGNVNVTGTDADKIVVNIAATGSRHALDQMTLDAQSHGEGVVVTAKRGNMRWFDWVWGSSDVVITVAVPRRYNLQLGTSGGNISVTRLEGTTNGRTSGGNIHLENLQGDVRMKTSGGDVDIAKVVGHVNLQTSGGNIRVHTIDGDFDGYTSGGDVRVEVISGVVKLHTSGGNIDALRINGPIDVYTSGGDVRLARIDGAIKAKTSGGDISAELVGVNRGINVMSSGGEIVLQLPDRTTGTLEASSSSGKIRSELPVTSTLTGESRLNGTINGGGEQIYARTSGGDIVLRAMRSGPATDQRVERAN